MLTIIKNHEKNEKITITSIYGLHSVTMKCIIHRNSNVSIFVSRSKNHDFLFI